MRVRVRVTVRARVNRVRVRARVRVSDAIHNEDLLLYTLFNNIQTGAQCDKCRGCT